MDDLISRQAAIDEIAEWIKAFLENGHKESAADARLIQDGIIQLPSAQPEPCGEVVSREVVVKFFNDWMSALDINCHHQSVADLRIIKGDIKNLPSAQSEPHWIPCSERLPFAECGESDNVLATCGYRGVEDTSIRWIRTLYFDGDCWYCPTGGTYDQRVYAWMPLPEPWRGDSICK